MRQWLAIVAIIWAAAAMQHAGEYHPHDRRVEIRTAELTQHEQPVTATDDSPLLATASAPAQRILGAEQVPGKSYRPSAPVSAAILHAHDHTSRLRQAPATLTGHIPCPTNRLGNGYIYFLRRLII